MKAKPRIMIAEDEPEVLESIEYILELHEYEVVGKAVDGMEVMEKYFDLNPDLLLLDIAMPRMDGIKVIKNIIKAEPKAKILVVSALYRPEVRSKCLKAGALDFLLKPFEVMELVNAIESIMKTGDEE